MLLLYIINKYDKNQTTLLAGHSYCIGNWLRMSLKNLYSLRIRSTFSHFFFSEVVQIFENIADFVTVALIL